MTNTPEKEQDDEGKAELPSKRRWYQYSLLELLAVSVLLIVFIGAIAGLNTYAYIYADDFEYMDWVFEIRRSLGESIGYGFLTTYWALASTDFPGWFCAAVIAFSLGLIRNRYTHVAAVVLSISSVITEMISRFVIPSFLFIPKLWLVCFTGGLISIFSWFVGWIIRGRHYDAARPIQNKWISIAILVILLAIILPLSIFGWWVLRIPLPPEMREALEM